MKPVEIEFLVKNNTRQGLSGVSGGIEGVEKDAAIAQKRIQTLEAEIERLHKIMAATPKMDQSENIRQIETLQRELQALQNTAKKTDLTPVNAQTVQRTYNGLNMSIQQMARELPSLTMGPQMFFMAISNNLPIFTDELARARKEYDLLTASGQKATPVWKQVVSSIGSFQTLLAVGITLAVVYGKEIGNFVSSLFRGKSAFDTVSRSAEIFHATMLEGVKNAQKEKTELDLLYKAATDTSRSTEERVKAVSKLQDIYPEYFGNMSREQIMLGQARDRYDELTAAIIRTARAEAARDKIAENSRKILDIQASKEYQEYASQARFAEESSIESLLPRAQGSEEGAARLKWELERSAEVQGKTLFNAYKKAHEEVADEIERLGVTSFREYIEALEQINHELAPEATKLYTDPLQEGGSSTGDPSVSLERQYLAAKRRMQQAINEQTVALLQEGAEKEREQIRLDYEKKRQQYEDEERKMLALIKKLRASGATVDPEAEKQVMATSAAAIASAAKLRDKQLEEIDGKEAATYEKLLQKYETYQQGRLRLAQKYDADIAKLAADPENQEMARLAKQKALDEFDVKFASQFPQFEAWADRVVAASITRLEQMVVEAQEELENLQSEFPDNNNAIAIARAKAASAERQLAKKRAEMDNKATDTTSWTELHRVLTDVVDTFDKAGDAIGGTAGEIVSAAGSIAGSTLQMINTIQAFQKAKANKDKLGMASGILGGISAGINVLTTIFGLFDGGESSMERNLRLAREFNEELRIMKERSKIDSDAYDSIFGDRLYDRYKQNIEVVRAALDSLHETQEQILSRGKEVFDSFSKGSTGLANLDKVAKTWETVAGSVYNMQVQTRHSTWFRSAQYKSLGSLIPELFDDGELNMEALKEFVENGGDNFKHLSDANRNMLKSLVDDWETYEEAIGAVNDYLQDIFGDLGNTLTDALVDAFENGTDAAGSFVESAGQAMRKLAKDMIYSNTIGQAFEDAQRRFDEINRENLSDEDRFAKWSETMQQMVSDALGQQDDFNKMWEEFRRIAAANGLSIDEAQQGTTQSGKAGAINTVTQESFSRVEGLVTSIQIHAANMDDAVEEGIIPTLGKSLDELRKIATNTESLPLMYDMLVKFDREGIKVK